MTLAEEQFNYGDLNDSHKSAAQEILNLLNLYKDPLIVQEMIKKNFELNPKPKYDHSTSPFLAACNEINLPTNIQGWVDDNGTLYPLFFISADVRELDKLFFTIIKNVQ